MLAARQAVNVLYHLSDFVLKEGTTVFNRPFDMLALLGDILPAFGDVSVGLN
jgi:hypothetical protein